MKKAKHIIWIIVDSMRSYVTGKDDRDKLNVMKDIALESTEFANVLCSAPSSLMSIGSMMSSIPAYYIGVNYKDFKCNTELFPSFPIIWKEAGYNFVSFLNSLETREVFDGLLSPVGREYLPKGLNPFKKRWSNAQVNEVLKKYLSDNTFEVPTCFFIWFNIRLDPETSDEVNKTISLFKQAKFWDDSFFIITADHGYLDPKRGYTPEKLKEMGLSHDILVTEDQIKIPLCIRYPEIPIQNIKTTVSALDIVPTLLEYFNLNYPSDSFLSPSGKSLLGLIEKGIFCEEERLIRADGRFMFQPGRVTAIRGERYKYVYHHDKDKEEFFDISKDFFEENNLIVNLEGEGLTAEFTKFRDYFKNSEKEIGDFILMNIFEKFKNKISSKIKISDIKLAFVYQMCEQRYFELFISICHKIFGDIEIVTSNVIVNDTKLKEFDLKISICDYTCSNNRENLLNNFKKIKAKHEITLDININDIDSQNCDNAAMFIKVVKRELRSIRANPRKIFTYYTKLKRIYWYIIRALKVSLFK